MAALPAPGSPSPSSRQQPEDVSNHRLGANHLEKDGDAVAGAGAGAVRIRWSSAVPSRPGSGADDRHHGSWLPLRSLHQRQRPRPAPQGAIAAPLPRHLQEASKLRHLQPHKCLQSHPLGLYPQPYKENVQPQVACTTRSFQGFAVRRHQAAAGPPGDLIEALSGAPPHQPSVAPALPTVLALVKSSKALANWEVALGTARITARYGDWSRHGRGLNRVRLVEALLALRISQTSRSGPCRPAQPANPQAY